MIVGCCGVEEGVAGGVLGRGKGGRRAEEGQKAGGVV